MASNLQYVTDQSGTYIPASQRPDGTWRKARRVKDGYIPQEEVPLYESKGKQWARDRANYIPGYNPVEPSPKPATLPANDSNHHHIPGLNPPPSSKSGAKKKKKKKAAAQDNKEPSETLVEDSPPPLLPKEVSSKEVESLANNVTTLSIYKDPSKRIRNLKKRLREIDALKAKIESGEVASPDKDQLEKIARREEIEAEIEELEAQIEE